MVAARRAAAGALTALLLASSSGSPLAAEVLPASIHGVVLGPDGKPATDHAMVLIDDRGATAGRATTRPGGRSSGSPSRSSTPASVSTSIAWDDPSTSSCVLVLRSNA